MVEMHGGGESDNDDDNSEKGNGNWRGDNDTNEGGSEDGNGYCDTDNDDSGEWIDGDGDKYAYNGDSKDGSGDCDGSYGDRDVVDRDCYGNGGGDVGLVLVIAQQLLPNYSIYFVKTNRTRKGST